MIASALFHTSTNAEIITDWQLQGKDLVLQGPYPGMSFFTGAGTLSLYGDPLSGGCKLELLMTKQEEPRHPPEKRTVRWESTASR